MPNKNLQQKVTQQELDLIILDYKNGIKVKDIAVKYSRADSTIINRLRKVGIYKDSTVRWMRQEVELLKDIYSDYSWDIILTKIPRHSKNSIMVKASKLKLTKESFFCTEDDVNILKENYRDESIDKVAKLLNYKYTIRSIRSKAQSLNIKIHNKWSEEEKHRLKRNYNELNIVELLELFPYRNELSIKRVASKLGLIQSQDYTESEIQYIKDNWKFKSDAEIAHDINRTHRSVKWKRGQMSLFRNDDTYRYENLSKYIRNNNSEWKLMSMKNCNFACVISSERFDEIHHLYGSNLILNETLFLLKLPPYKDINKYTEIELKNILDTYKKIQAKHPHGACLTKGWHKSFHDKYGYGNNTPEQFEEFLRNLNQTTA